MSWADTVSGRARRAVRLGLNAVGRIAVADIRNSINVPVELIEGPRGGIEVIRSEEGEPPRREIEGTPGAEAPGWLWRSISYKVDAGATSLSNLSVQCSCPYGPTLEIDLNRPFWEPARRRLEQYGPHIFKQAAADALSAQTGFAEDFDDVEEGLEDED